MSQGRATFTMEFAKYLEVPNNVPKRDEEGS
jgi:translation elongation factor EF-G